jgi:catechol 2,3-dioxygenase-like lactoylglutathione lyase family enzyme
MLFWLVIIVFTSLFGIVRMLQPSAIPLPAPIESPSRSRPNWRRSPPADVRVMVPAAIVALTDCVQPVPARDRSWRGCRSGTPARAKHVTQMPVISRVLETALYVDDLDVVVGFYRDVLGLRVLDASARFVSLDAGQATILLIFKRGATVSGVDTSNGWIPPHDGHGPVHLAFAIGAGALAGWELRLQQHGVPIESHVAWERGGHSIYFRDPAGHSVELATPGTWAVY